MAFREVKREFKILVLKLLEKVLSKSTGAFSKSSIRITYVFWNFGKAPFQSLCLLLCVFFCFACGAKWQGRIVHLQDGKIVIRPEDHDRIKSGRKVLIYRQKTITHPVTNVVLGTITDKIGEFPVVWVRDHTVTVNVPEPEFSMMMVDDQAVAARDSVKTPAGSVYEAGRIENLEAKENVVQVAVRSGALIGIEGLITVIRYTDTVIDPYSNEVLAVAVEPVADLKMKSMDSAGRYSATYKLVNEKLGFLEIDDVVVNRTGGMIAEGLWFQDPPDGFDESWIFNRNYLRAIRYYNSGLYREAILELSDVVKIEPGYKDASYLLGLCYTNVNRDDEAMIQFNDILKQNPDDVKTWAALGYLYLNQGKLMEAANAYEKLALLIPEETDLWMDLGDIYSMLGDQGKAEWAYRKAFEINKNKKAAYELQIKEVK